MKFITFTREILSRQHLSLIREIGRQIGVKAPSEKPKDKLIQDILDIQSGVVEPTQQNTKGAHVKMKFDLSEFMVEDDCNEKYKSHFQA